MAATPTGNATALATGRTCRRAPAVAGWLGEDLRVAEGRDWSELTRYLETVSDDPVDLSFAQIEAVIGGPLPASCRYPAFWSNSSSYAKVWRSAGFVVSRRGRSPGVIGFHRAGAPRAALEAAPPVDEQDPPSAVSAVSDVVLVGCVKSKADHPAPACSLYQSALFDRRRRYAEGSGCPWFVLSAEHGLVDPDTVIAPYDVYLAAQPEEYRRVWGEWVTVKLARALGPLRGCVIEVHAGAAYVEAVAPALEARGAVVRAPLAGLRRGEQLAWYDQTPVPGSTPAPASAPAVARTPDTAAIVTALLAFGQSAAAEQQPPAPVFTPHESANRLILTDPFAFLLGVVFDQGVTAERAWEAPYLLRQRLGHLDPARIAAEPHAVHAAIGLPPALHRYREKTPQWVTEAAVKVMEDYGGDASQIWADQPTAAELRRRLDSFPGIGQKKAAMAVEILVRHFGVPVAELSGSDIAYDVHVRRVLLRTGLAQRDDPAHMIAVARALHPERPGALDDPAWRIGRLWCHPSSPECDSCTLNQVCPQLKESAAAVRGA